MLAAINEFAVPSTGGGVDITVGPDGNLYFTEQSSPNGVSVNDIGRITTAGQITEFPIPSRNIGASGIITGSDGNLWFAENLGSRIGRFDPIAGTFAEFSSTGNFTVQSPYGITAGPDGNLWFTEDSPTSHQIGRITTQGVITKFDVPGVRSGRSFITTGSDGNLWFTEPNADRIGRITPAGQVTEFSVGITPGSAPFGITSGPDGNLWFTESGGIGRIDPATTTVTEFPVPAIPGASSRPEVITNGPDSNLWFTDQAGNRIGRITPSGQVAEFSAGISPASFLFGVTSGPDGNLWFAEGAGRIGQVILPARSVNGGALAVRPTEGAPITAAFARFADNSAAAVASNFGATIDYGDGTIGPASIVPDGSGGFFVVGTHTYNEEGTYTASVSIGNETGTAMPIDVAVSVADAPLTATAANVSAVENTPFAGIVASFTDADPLGTLSDYMATIDWGDGTSSPGTVAAAVAGFTISGRHDYLSGTYPVTVTIADLGGSRVTVVGTATVAPNFVVTNTSDDGPGSLRRALLNANNLPVGAAITFAIPASFTNPSTGVATIVPLTTLPALVNRTVIDGSSQALFAGRPASSILVQIDGRSALYSNGIVFDQSATSSVLQGVAVFGFAGNQVVLDADGETVRASYIGLPVDPAAASGPAGSTSAGLLIHGAGVAVGGLNPADRDVISGNGYHGVLFTGPRATGGFVFQDYIGTDPSGTAARPNVGDGIVAIDGAGGLTVKFNVISGNGGNGVEFYGSSGNVVAGNLIGTDATGGLALGNAGSGICLDVGSSNNTVGGTAFGTNNVISANGVTGLAIQVGSNGNTVENNRVGTNSLGTAALGNGDAGILVLESAGNVIGPGNLVSGNGALRAGAGIWIDGTTSTGNRVTGNLVGTSLDGESAVPNRSVGVVVSQAPGNVIGGGNPGDGNLISGNTSIGLEISGDPATGITALGEVVQGNVIGLDASGTRKLGNGGSRSGVGLYLLNAPGNTIGGPSLALGNVVSGNNFDGVELFGPGTTGNVLQFNRIGTNLAGTGPCGNAVDGLVFDGTGSNTAASNFLASNGRNGVFVAGSSGVVLTTNQIGLGVGGQALGNGAFGLLIGTNSKGLVEQGDVNLNNLLGPVRNTDISPGSQGSSAGSNPSVTGHGSGGSVVSQSSKGKHAVKVQPKAKSFGGRQVAKAAPHAKPHARPRAKH